MKDLFSQTWTSGAADLVTDNHRIKRNTSGALKDVSHLCSFKDFQLIQIELIN